MSKAVQLEILKKNINLGGLVRDEIDLALEPALQKVVENTSTPFDNVAKEALYPVLRQELEKVIAEEVDTLFDKLLGEDEQEASEA